MHNVSSVQSPVVSVVMPVYNASRYLVDAVDSILSQSLKNIELIIVDDGSTDGSDRIVLRYQSKDDRVRAIRHTTNWGNYPSRNEGMESARADFIAVMDADDVALPGRLERQVEFLRRRPDHVLVGSQVLLVDPEGSSIGRKPGIISGHHELDEALLRGEWVIVHPSVLMRKSSVKAIGGYRERFATCADQDLYVRLAEIGRIENISDVLLHYRQHYASLTRLQSEQQRNLHIIQHEARERRNLPPLKKDEIPPIKKRIALGRREKMRLRYKWAELAIQQGYKRTAFKNLSYAFALDPIGALRITLSRGYHRLFGR